MIKSHNIYLLYLPVCLSISLNVWMSVCPSFCRYIRLTLYLACMFFFLSICMSVFYVFPFAGHPLYLSVCKSFYLSICLYMHLSLYQNISNKQLLFNNILPLTSCYEDDTKQYILILFGGTIKRRHLVLLGTIRDPVFQLSIQW